MEHGENGPATLAKISEMMFNLLNQSQDRLQMQFEEERSKHVLLIEEQRKQLDTQELVIKEMEVDRTKLFRANVLLKKQIGELSSLSGGGKRGGADGEEVMEAYDGGSLNEGDKEEEKPPPSKKQPKEKDKEKEKEREKEKENQKKLKEHKEILKNELLKKDDVRLVRSECPA